MKLVLNKQFGGFQLSPAAKIELAKRKHVDVKPYWVGWNDEEGIEPYQPDESTSSHDFLLMLPPDYLSQPRTTHEAFNDAWDPNFDEYKNRNDPDLVAVVEMLREAASGKLSYLKVVEIPDGCEYKISDYDGVETVYYGHDLGEI